MTTDVKQKVISLGNIGTLTTTVQTFDDSDEVNIFQTLTLNNSDETSVVSIENSNKDVPLLGNPEDVSEVDSLMQFLTSFE
jgi:hypothetical protein